MEKAAKKWALFILRWGIAVAGIGWVLSQISLRDHAWILDADHRPVEVVLAQRVTRGASQWEIIDPQSGQQRTINRADLVNPPDRPGAQLTLQGEPPATVRLLALDLNDSLTKLERLLVADSPDGPGRWVTPQQVVGGYSVQVPYPPYELGVVTLLHHANPMMLWGAVLIFPITFLITTIRWHALLKALEIEIPHTRVFVINMVGAFYNTFMPGSTGGDLLKAYYASKQTTHRARAVFSVLVDRIIGLMALIVMGGAMAALQYFSAATNDDATQACGQVALGSALIIAAAVVGLVVIGYPAIRRVLGVDYILKRLPLQKHVQHVVDAMRIYRTRPGLILGSLIVTLPVHVTVVVSAMLIGKAFGLPLPAFYYFVVVPVVVLAGALPLAPQGAGVMEFFAIHLTGQYGTPVAQAFVLTMAIRIVQILWNLTGGVFVLRGGYHAPTSTEQEELEREADAETEAAAEEQPCGR